MDRRGGLDRRSAVGRARASSLFLCPVHGAFAHNLMAGSEKPSAARRLGPRGLGRASGYMLMMLMLMAEAADRSGGV